MKTGLDTSVVLRLLLGQPADQTARAVALLDDLARQGRQAVASVLATDWQASAKPGFVDRLIHGAYTAEADEMATLEKAAGKLKSVRVL
jgi:ParB-like chromosome segregation protein Spo0J